MNFEKLKKLINEYEKGNGDIHGFYCKLKNVAEYELRNKQIGLGEFL